MGAFVILAAGEGTRMGRQDLPKPLLPLEGKALVSHIIDRVPEGEEIIVVVGHREMDVCQYLSHAHPGVKTIYAWNYAQKGSGPASSLLMAREKVDHREMTVCTCDTLWHEDPYLWDYDESWAAVAPAPEGSDRARWCWMKGSPITSIVDKEDPGDGYMVWTGLLNVAQRDLQAFWTGLEFGCEAGHPEISEGIQRIPYCNTRHIGWRDAGDAESYDKVVEDVDGYDYSKPGQATYVLPEAGKVIKWFSVEEQARQRHERALLLRPFVPVTDFYGHFLIQEYVEGVDAYRALANGRIDIYELINQCESIWKRKPDGIVPGQAMMQFYRDKTESRIGILRDVSDFKLASEAVALVDWEALVVGVQPSVIHGDMTFANLIVAEEGTVKGVDWRGDFAGFSTGDRRYDIAKLLTSTVVHWEAARHGNFDILSGSHREYADAIRQSAFYTKECEIIGALCLLNSAPLHAAPFDEILVQRGVRWLQKGTT